jgi:VanZ family protein
MKRGWKRSGALDDRFIFGGEISPGSGVCQTSGPVYTANLNFRSLLKAWLPVVLWLTLMLFGSTDLMSSEHTSRFLAPFLHWLRPDMSGASVAQAQRLVRKMAHVSEYAILTGLLFRALSWSIDGFWRRAGMALIPALIVAPVDEFHQRFVPSRNSSPIDVLIDYSGAIVGILVCWVIQRALRPQARPPDADRLARRISDEIA